MTSALSRVCTALILLTMVPLSLAFGFTISGTVTDPGSQPVNNVDVFLYDDVGNPIGIPQTRTDNNGLYSILNIPAGTYAVEFVPKVSTLLLPFTVSPVVVSGNTTVNAQLSQGNQITGLVTDTLGNPLLDIDLNVYLQSTGTLITTPGDNTDATGHFSILVGDGTYTIRWRSTLVGQRWVPVEISNVVITNDTTINVTMVSGYFLSGIVRNQALAPVFDADLDIIVPSTGAAIVTPSDNTDAAGFYQLLIPGGTFDIQVEPLSATKLVPKESLSVAINADKTINFVLQNGFLVSGNVSASGGGGLAAVDINANYASSGARLFTPFDNTDGAGNYSMVFPAGSYTIAYRPPVASSKAPVVISPVSISKDTVINVVAPSGVVLTATISGPGGPAAGVDIDAFKLPAGTDTYLFDDITNASGVLSVVVTPGSYRLTVNPSFASKLVGKQYPNQALNSNTNLPISLQAGFVLSGVATDSADMPVSGVRVRAIDASTSDTIYTPGDTSSAAGYYDVVVPADVYNLRYVPRSGSVVTDTIKLNSVSITKDTTVNVSFQTGGSGCKCGDADGNGLFTISDAVFLIGYIFAGGPAPTPICRGDADGNGLITISDAVYMISYIFAGGPAPHCP